MELYTESGEPASLEDVIEWWLQHYEGLEHLTEGGTTAPECWYTINTILRRCLEQLKNDEGA
jgi:hypothetical protein